MTSPLKMPRGPWTSTMSIGLPALIVMLAIAGFSGQGGSGETLAAAPNANFQYGFTMALLQNNTEVKNMGFQWVSYTLGWDSAEPSQGTFDWGNADNITNYARNARVNVLIRVSRSPAWARDPACSGSDTCPPANPADFGTFMAALAAHVRPMIAPYRVAYEIWNEPNTEQEWGGICPDATRYTGLLRAAYPAVKAADPNATVVGGAVTTVAQRQTLHPDVCPVDDITFIEGMYAAGAAPFFDVLSDHPYGFASEPEADPLTTHPALVFRRAERHRQVMEANGDAAKQIWATEMGWAIDPRTEGAPCGQPDWYFIFNPQQQADYLVRAYQWARSYWPWMGAMFTFNYDFNEAPWYETCHPFRYWSVRGRPAQAALAAMVQNPPPTYTPVVDNPPEVSAVRYSALSFTRSGGQLTVDVDASDNDQTAVDSVNAILQYPDGSSQLFVFSLVAGTPRSGTWRGTIPIPPNSGSNTEAYTVSPYVVEAEPQRRSTNAPPQHITVTSTSFADVPSDFWAATYIEYLAGRGVISGYSDNTFRPNNNATRGQFSKMIVLGEGWPIDLTSAPHFTDVPPGSTFYEYVETAVNHGVISGYADRTFRPNNNITRGQIAKIIVLAQAWPLENPITPTFVDVLPGSPFYGYVETAVAHEIISGYADRTFRPNNLATRAQLSKMLYLALTGGGTPTPTAIASPAATDTPTSTPGVKAPPRPKSR
ncbi:MAG: S-layer homology domain-containing protein [Chloroflexia bacterium]